MVPHGLRALPVRDFAAGGSDSQTLVDEAVELARILTGASGSAVAFRGEHATICRARSGEGAPQIGAQVDITSGISRRCLDSGKPLWCDDLASDSGDSRLAQVAGIREFWEYFLPFHVCFLIWILRGCSK